MSYYQHFDKSVRQPEDFWMEQAEQLAWYHKPQTAFSPRGQGVVDWFPDGTLNTCYLAVDVHIAQGRGAQTAMIYESPVTKKRVAFSFNDLLHHVSKTAWGLQQLGVQKGDTVVIYMPMIPEAVFAMLACARLGAIHSVVFGGFAARELAIRIDDAKPKVLLTATSGIEVDKVIPYKPMVDAAMAESRHQPNHVVVFNRNLGAPNPKQLLDLDWGDWLQDAKTADCVPVKSTDPLYILYTSGTTGKPKGIVRDNGGHAVALRYSMATIYGLKPGDIFWAASDIGWVVGHSYIVYAPLLTGCTTVLFEGKPIRTPDAGTFWRIIEQNRVNVMFTAPTAIRAIRKEDPYGAHISSRDLSCLRAQFLAGERCDIATLEWLQQQLGIPVIDHWWQTESGWPMLANFAGLDLLPIIPGAAGFPVPGYQLEILREDGSIAASGEPGYVAIKLPLPPGCLPTLWGDAERFYKGYLERFPGYYFSGDGGYREASGHVFITGRVDDIINVAGHRLSTAEMEEVVSSHPDVSECAVVGMADALKGQVPLAFVVCKGTPALGSEALTKALVGLVRDKIGPVAAMKNVVLVPRLPKTRSGKILRKTLRALADGEQVSIPATIDDPTILGEIRELLQAFNPTAAPGKFNQI
jgi:acyl-coenzyme A synthetase/AMP-(fatty) acid ligase